MTVLVTRSYLSTHHLWASLRFARQCHDIESSHPGGSGFSLLQRSAVMASVLSAVAFLEAVINEFFQDIVDGHNSYVSSLDKEVRAALGAFWQEGERSLRLLQKYQASLALAHKPLLDRGSTTFQDVHWLIKPRNELVHFRPEDAVAGVPSSLEKQLGMRFDHNPLIRTRGNPFFPDRCLGSGCAGWSARSARAFADEVFHRLGVKPNYQHFRLDKDQLEVPS